jgi:hypothetical protein
LLALSGMLFLVPLAAPVHATQDASLPTISTNYTAYIVATPTVGTTLTITNPITNSYSITTVTIFAPSGFVFTASTGAPGTYLNSESIATASAETFTIAGVSTGIAPGFSDMVTLGTITANTLSPATAAPPTGTFTTTIIDAGSAPGSYPGPVWTAYDVAGTTLVTSTTSSTTYVAGSAPLTITVSDGSGQPGVPVTFKSTGTPHTGFTTSLSPTSGFTGSTGMVTSTFQPSNYATDTTTVKGTIGGGIGVLTGASATITTLPAAATKVTFYYSAGTFPATEYVSAYVPISGVNYANVPASTITFSATDQFGNPAGATVTGGTLTAANGFLYGTTTTTTCTITAGAGLCQYNTGTNLGSAPQYSQSGVFGSIGQMSATLTGTGFSVSGTTGFLQTSTFATTAIFKYPNTAATVAAGTTADIEVLLGVVQVGVPIKIQVCVDLPSSCPSTSLGYTGTFSNGLSSISGVTNSSGTFGSAFTISPKLHAAVEMNATISTPANSGPQSFTINTGANLITTGPGAAAKFQLYATFFDSQVAGQSGPSTNFATAGATLYVDAILTDAYGNIVINALLQQIQINMAASGVSGGGLLSATNIYLSSGCSSTNQTGILGSCLGSFGPVAWTLPTTLGASTVTATAVINGVQVVGAITVTTISPIPTLSVTSPKPVSGVIYSSSPFVTFSGKANVSLGYPSIISPVTISTMGYKVNSNPWVQFSVASGSKIVWSVPVTLATGLSTIMFNATDSKSNTVVSASYRVLVDSVAPTFTFASATSNNGCMAVTITTAAGDFNTATTGTGAFTATFGGVAVSPANIAFTGTQTLGSPSTLTATICGLTSQTATLTVTGSTLAGVAGTASETLTITVSFADSVTFNTATATYGINGAYKGVTVTVTNGWNIAQTLVVYATFKSGTSIYVADGTVTLAAGATAPVFCIDLQTIPAGSYTVTFAAVTTSNQAVSAPTTGITLVTT